MYVGVSGLSGVRPLRRRKFCAGCSRVEYQQIGAVVFSRGTQYGPSGLGTVLRGDVRFSVWHTVGS